MNTHMSNVLNSKFTTDRNYQYNRAEFQRPHVLHIVNSASYAPTPKIAPYTLDIDLDDRSLATPHISDEFGNERVDS